MVTVVVEGELRAPEPGDPGDPGDPGFNEADDGGLDRLVLVEPEKESLKLGFCRPDKLDFPSTSLSSVSFTASREADRKRSIQNVPSVTTTCFNKTDELLIVCAEPNEGWLHFQKNGTIAQPACTCSCLCESVCSCKAMLNQVNTCLSKTLTNVSSIWAYASSFHVKGGGKSTVQTTAVVIYHDWS